MISQSSNYGVDVTWKFSPKSKFLKGIKIKLFKFYFIFEYFNFKFSICWAQSDAFGVESKGLDKIR